MRKLCLLIALTGVLASYQCFALTVTVVRNAGYYGAVANEAEGGEFTVTATDPSNPLFQNIIAHYDSSTMVNGGFETFCLDINVPLYPNPQGATVTPTGVSMGVAWLYNQFVKQSLAGYIWAPGGSAAAGGTGTGRANSAFMLQNAIWELEGQSGYDVGAAAYYVGLATAHFGSLAAAEAAANGAFQIDQLVLTYPAGSGNLSQPMLAFVPDGGATVMLLGLALGSFCFVSRKMRLV
jgi:hypothetical protein